MSTVRYAVRYMVTSVHIRGPGVQVKAWLTSSLMCSLRRGVLSRGHFCPKDHQQHLELTRFYPPSVVAYTQGSSSAMLPACRRPWCSSW